MKTVVSSSKSSIVLDKIAVLLFAIFLVYSAASLLPIRFDPSSVIRFCTSVRSITPLALIAGVLVILSNILRSSEQTLKRYFLVRKFFPIIAILFFLFIPMQGLASLKALQIAKDNSNIEISNLRRTLFQIKSAPDVESLRAAIGKLPGAPDNYKLTLPIEEVKRQLLEQIDPQVRRLETDVETRYSQIYQNSVGEWLRDSIISLLYALAFRSFRYLSKLPT